MLNKESNNTEITSYIYEKGQFYPFKSTTGHSFEEENIDEEAKFITDILFNGIKMNAKKVS